jgi:methionine sulfoxide reductase heme-binding subunit
VTQNQILRWVLKPAVFIAALVPALILFYLTWAAYNGQPSAWPALTGNFSANPLEDITHGTGDWALRFLCITLAITPLRRLTGWNGAIRFRRMLGLFAFFYATLHFLTYALLDRFASLDFTGGVMTWGTVRALMAWIVDDIYKRPFITIGFAAFVALVPLALTSTAGMIRRLGGRRWQRLHRLIYPAAIAGVVHYWMLVKSDIRLPLYYGIVVAVLLGVRLYWARTKRPQERIRTGGVTTGSSLQADQSG